MIARISVALVAIPTILWICYQGGAWLSGMVLLFAVTAYQEFLYAEKISPKNFLFWFCSLFFLCFFVMSLTLFEFELAEIGKNEWVEFIRFFNPIAFILLLGVFFSVKKDPADQLFLSYVRLVWGTFYIGYLYPFVIRIGEISFWKPNGFSGGDLLLFLFAILWVGDSAALFVGKAIGKHKLAPSVSPNKTVEGFIGGLAGAVVVGVIMYIWKFNIIAWYHIMLIAIGCSIFGQLGDLVESMWKRSLNIKDSSNIIPGHGGILDRFDSLLFAAPFMYIYLLLLY